MREILWAFVTCTALELISVAMLLGVRGHVPPQTPGERIFNSLFNVALAAWALYLLGKAWPMYAVIMLIVALNCIGLVGLVINIGLIVWASRTDAGQTWNGD